MKVKILLLWFIFMSSVVFSQKQESNFEKAHYSGDFKKYIAKRIYYPLDLQKDLVKGDVLVSFRINKTGQLDSVKIRRSPDEQLSKQIAKVLNGMTGSWTASKIEGESVSFWYNFIVEYRIKGTRDKSLKLYTSATEKFNKSKNEAALEKINKAIVLKPYKPEYYVLRSKIYKAKDDAIKAQDDILKCSELKQSSFPKIKIVAYTTSSSKVVKGNRRPVISTKRQTRVY